MTIVWPKELDPNEGWSSSREANRLISNREPRTWHSLTTLCHRNSGVSLGKLIEELGGPEARNLGSIDIEDVKTRLKDFLEKEGRRPSTRGSRDPQWRNLNMRLRKRGLPSIAQLCDQLGASGRLRRTREIVDQEIRSFYRRYGKRPTEAGSWNEWHGHATWLRDQGTSLSEACDELDLSGGGREDHDDSFTAIRKDIKSYWEAHRTRPTAYSGPKWRNLSARLYRQGHSLSKLCDELGLPDPRTKSRTAVLASLKIEVMDFYKTHGKRPLAEGVNSTPNERRMGRSAIFCGTRLKNVCDELRLPSRQREMSVAA
jgi:hypothetical protein